MNELEKLRGVVENFERSTETTGGQNTTRTTHLSIFKIGSNNVLLRTITPSVISDGDEVVLAGSNLNGRFQAIACKNLTSNWISPLRQQKFVFFVLVFFAVSTLLLFFLIIPIFMSAACMFLAHKVKQRDALHQKAHDMVQQF